MLCYCVVLENALTGEYTRFHTLISYVLLLMSFYNRLLLFTLKYCKLARVLFNGHSPATFLYNGMHSML